MYGVPSSWYGFSRRAVWCGVRLLDVDYHHQHRRDPFRSRGALRKEGGGGKVSRGVEGRETRCEARPTPARLDFWFTVCFFVCFLLITWYTDT